MSDGRKRLHPKLSRLPETTEDALRREHASETYWALCALKKEVRKLELVRGITREQIMRIVLSGETGRYFANGGRHGGA